VSLEGRRAALVVCAVWLGFRVLFFQGLYGFDDLYHVEYALHLDHLPKNHWETRLLYNGLLALSIRSFGFSKWVLALPTLLGSLAFTLGTWWTARRLAGDGAGLLAGIFASSLVIDVTLSTNPSASAFANGFAAVGTGVLLASGGRPRFLLGAGVLLGFSILAHPVMLFYVGILSGVSAAVTLPKLAWRPALIVLTAALCTFLACDLSAFWWITGNPLYEFSVVAKTHLANQQFVEPFRLASRAINPRWVVWPFVNLLASKPFGLFISVPLCLGLLSWHRLEPPLRAATITIVAYWAWICFGSQHPLHYLPLDHDTRYWYPAALLACVLAATLVQRISVRWRRGALSSLLVLSNVILLLLSGSWGQNVEISRELLRYADGRPKELFVTDRYSYDEIYILLGGRPPQNIGLIGRAAGTFCAPVFSYPQPTSDSVVQVLYNPLQEWRPDFQPVLRAVRGAERHSISNNRYRALAYLLPVSFRERHPVLIRKPAAQLVVGVIWHQSGSP
jgi:hypothetical protein